MNKKYLKLFIGLFILFFCFSLILPKTVLADKKGLEQFNAGLNDTRVGSGYSSTGDPGRDKLQLYDMITRVVKTLLGLLGVIFIILIIYAGFIWMLARGNEQEVEKAKKIIQNSIIGLIIVLSAYAIASFVGGSLTAEPISQNETT